MNRNRRLGGYLLAMLVLVRRRADGAARLGNPQPGAARPGDPVPTPTPVSAMVAGTANVRPADRPADRSPRRIGYPLAASTATPLPPGTAAASHCHRPGRGHAHRAAAPAQRWPW